MRKLQFNKKVAIAISCITVLVVVLAKQPRTAKLRKTISA